MDVKFRLLIGICLSFLLILLNGCFESSDSDVQEGAITGKEGVQFVFVPNNPPSRVYSTEASGDDSSIPIELDVFNRGAANTDVKAKFSGFDKGLITISGLEAINFNSGDIDRKSRYNPEGGYKAVGASMSLDENKLTTEQYDFNLNLVYCYNYYTKASLQLCVDPMPHKSKLNDGCTATKSLSTEGQGAPIGVSEVVFEPMPRTLRARITIQNYGAWEVVDNGQPLDSCGKDVKRNKEDIVHFSGVKLGGKEGKCMPSDNSDNLGELRLRENKGDIVCTFDLSGDAIGDSSYSAVLSLKLDYQIRDSIKKPITIINDQLGDSGPSSSGPSSSEDNHNSVWV